MLDQSIKCTKQSELQTMRITNLEFGEDKVVMENDWAVIFSHLQKQFCFLVYNTVASTGLFDDHQLV